MSRPAGPGRSGGPPGWWDRITASRHRRSILGSLAVLALLLVVVVSGLVGGGPPAPTPTPSSAPVPSGPSSSGSP